MHEHVALRTLPGLFLALTSAFALAACAARPEGTAQARAADDFQCPQYKVTTTQIVGGSYRAEGCGKSAVYNCTTSDASADALTQYTCALEAPPVAVPSPGATPASSAAPQAPGAPTP